MILQRHLCALLTLLIFSFSSGSQAAEKITVFAAASLTNALQEISDNYRKQHDTDIVASFASSSTLARQLEAGAPVDLFISADQQWMDYVQQKKMIDTASRHNLLGNDLVLVAANTSGLNAVTISEKTDWISLLHGQHLSVGDPDHVPAGIYAREALQSLSSWTTVEPLLARGSSVRAALALVERDETPLGIVYGSDAVASQKVKVLGKFPASSHTPIEYPMAIVANHRSPAVEAFYHYLQTPEAAGVFVKYGFTPLP
ncbi:MAG: Molybdate-binding protein ModA [Candidatus Erwinia impunctatus]|nr:Molybdate-binding protein ModA [Culicoides impunctatus]